MTSLARDVYELRLKVKIHELTGESYQNLFSDVMELAHPGDFVRVRPWGRDGDRKNDGFLRSERHLYQVYAPNEMSESDAKRKIRTDYEGALPHWETHFDRWTFVHNAYDGLGPGLLTLLLELGAGPPQRNLGHFGPAELRNKLFSLATEDVASVLGPPAQAEPASALEFDEIRTVLDRVSDVCPAEGEPVQVVPPGKLDANGFDENSRSIIRLGMARAHRVEEFLSSYMFDPELGSRVQEALKSEYQRLKNQDNDPNVVLSKLFTFVAGHRPSSEFAAMAVLGHFFETCDIFEAPAVANLQT